MRKLNHFLYILLIICFSYTTFSCKLFESKDTTAPTVNLTIEGGNEISREVTLYLDIEDDSKIDYVDIMIDDTTAVTVTTNFDTIRFDVTSFADGGEHQLYARVFDSEGNIGESEKLDVVIIKYEGWRTYNKLQFGDGNDTPIVVDKNGIVIIGSGSDLNGIFVFNPESGVIKNYDTNNSPLFSNYVIDLELIDEGKIWIANGDNVIEFDYIHEVWGSIIDLSQDQYSDKKDISAITLDRNDNLWIGTWGDGLFQYRNTQLIKHYIGFDLTSYGVHDLTVDQNNRLFMAPEMGSVSDLYGVCSIKDSVVTTYEFFKDIYWELVCIAADSSNNIWVSQGDDGFFFDGTSWSNIEQPDVGVKFDPMLITSDGILFTQSFNGLVSWDGNSWTDFSDFDTPFKDEVDNNLGIAGQSLAEAPNGDIWMVAGGKLMRYRPTSGGYP